VAMREGPDPSKRAPEPPLPLAPPQSEGMVKDKPPRPEGEYRWLAGTPPAAAAGQETATAAIAQHAETMAHLRIRDKVARGERASRIP
jgi:hypothetical protein